MTRRGSKNLLFNIKPSKDHLLLGVLVGKGTGGPLATEVVSLGVGGELEDSSLGVLSVGDYL
jgi:hypothetical protein